VCRADVLAARAPGFGFQAVYWMLCVVPGLLQSHVRTSANPGDPRAVHREGSHSSSGPCGSCRVDLDGPLRTREAPLPVRWLPPLSSLLFPLLNLVLSYHLLPQTTTDPGLKSLGSALDLISGDDKLWRGLLVDLVRVTMRLSSSDEELEFLLAALQACPRPFSN
jgi:hypothetical protein